MGVPEHRVPEVSRFALAARRQRLAVALVLVEGMSYKEAAGVLEISREVRRRNPHGLRRRRARCGTARRDRRRDRAGPGSRASRAGTPRAARQDGRRVSPDAGPAHSGASRSCCARRRARRTCGRGNVLQFPARSARAPSPPWRAREWVAMAASLLLGVLLSWRLLAPVRLRALRGGQGRSAGARRTRPRTREPARQRTER